MSTETQRTHVGVSIEAGYDYSVPPIQITVDADKVGEISRRIKTIVALAGETGIASYGAQGRERIVVLGCGKGDDVRTCIIPAGERTEGQPVAFIVPRNIRGADDGDLVAVTLRGFVGEEDHIRVRPLVRQLGEKRHGKPLDAWGTGNRTWAALGDFLTGQEADIRVAVAELDPDWQWETDIDGKRVLGQGGWRQIWPQYEDQQKNKGRWPTLEEFLAVAGRVFVSESAAEVADLTPYETAFQAVLPGVTMEKKRGWDKIGSSGRGRGARQCGRANMELALSGSGRSKRVDDNGNKFARRTEREIVVFSRTEWDS